MNETFATLAYSAVIAVTAAIFLRARGWGIAIPLILLGGLFGALPFGPDSIPEPEVILVFVLVPLVFGEALGSSFIDLRKVSRPVVVLAVGLVLASTFAVGYIGAAVTLVPFAMMVALGAILAPTDAVAVSQVAKTAHLPRRLVSILEGESLVNDGTGLTMLSVALVAATAGSITLMETLGIFGLSVVGGVGVGLVGGWLLARALRSGFDMVAVNALILVAPFALYLLAEEIHGSGILAVVVAGLMIAHTLNSEPDHGGRLQSVIVWRHIAFALQALAFFLVGLEFPEVFGRLNPDHLRTVLVLVPLVLVVMIVTRLVFVILMAWFAHRKHPQADRGTLAKNTIVLGWSGARGPVSGLAAFSIPLVLASGIDTPYRDVVIAVTFCVVFLTLLLSLTLAPLVRWLRVEPDDDSETLRHVNAQLLLAATEALDELEADAQEAGTPFSEAAQVQLRLDISRSAARHGIDTGDATGISRDEAHQMLHAAELMLRAQRRELLRMRTEEGLPESIVRPILRSLDARGDALKAME